MAKSGSTARRRALAPGSGTTAAAGDGPVESGARLLPLRAGFYALRLLPPDRGGGASAPSSIAVAQVCTAPGSSALEIANLSGREDQWLTGVRPLFVTVPPGGAMALLTGYRPRAGGAEPIEIEIRRLDRTGVGDSVQQNRNPDEKPTAMDCAALVLGLAPDALAGATGIFSFEATAVLRGGGEVGFLDTGWIGRLGRGQWIESFTVTPRPTSSAAPIEYKALTADGEETAWTASAVSCGTVGGAAPLIGFSVRQVPGSGPPVFDCEYSGYFQSGAVSGPARNGAPCLSPAPNDPLEGIRLRMIPRLPRTGA